MMIVDSDLLIDFLRDQKPVVSRLLEEIENNEICTTAVSRFELLAGVQSMKQLSTVQRFLDAIKTLPLDAAASDRAAEVHRDLSKKGQDIGMADSLIAGIVLNNKAALLTRNRKHFERVQGIHLGSLGLR